MELAFRSAILFGLYWSTFLAISYIPVHVTMYRVGNAIRDASRPVMPAPGADCADWCVQPAIFNFDDLAALTRQYVSDSALQTRLLGSIRQAADAASLGNLTQKQLYLAEFVGVVEKMKGVILPYVEADSLIQIAKSL